MIRFGIINFFLLFTVLHSNQFAKGQSLVLNDNNKSAINLNNYDFRNGKSLAVPYLNLLSCVVSFDGQCFFDESENVLRSHYINLWGKLCCERNL